VVNRFREESVTHAARFKPAFRLAVIGSLLGLVSLGAQEAPAADTGAEPSPVTNQLIASLAPPHAALVDEVLERNPDLARLRALASASAARAPQVRALPDPMVALTAFALTPETRVGPQEAAAAISQRFPWFGKLQLKERQALLDAEAARQAVEAKRLALITETRRLAYELGFLAAQETILSEDRETLVHYEELARARYASGVGLEQAVIKLQAEITRDDNRLLELANRRAALASALDALRDRPAGGAPPSVALPDGPSPLATLDLATLRSEAIERRPEVARARAMLAATGVGAELAQKEFRPDLTVGLGYTLVGKREDAPGRAMPPPGNGDDILGVTVGVNLPIWRQKLEAGVVEASARETAAQEDLRSTVTGIDQSLGELVARLPLLDEQLALFAGLLSTQAEEALRSAEAAYAAGSAGSLDLLDAERVLLEVRIGTARMRADSLIARARLEGALAAPLAGLSTGVDR